MTEPDTLPPNVHPEVAVLPWYFNGTLSTKEHTAIAMHLQECPSCRQELDDLVKVHAHVRQAAETGPLPSSDLVQAVIARVQQESLRQPDQSPAVPPVPTESSGFLAEADQWLRSVLTPQWVPTLVTLLLIGQIGLLTWSVGLQREPEPGSGTAGTVISRGLGTPPIRIEIEFEPVATMDQIQDLLQSVDGRIVGGPTARGTFIIELTAADAASPHTQSESLRNRRGLVRSVTTLAP